MNTFSQVPPGFRFHPTDEELVDYYLRKKVNSRKIELDVIKDIDLYKIEPWDLQNLCGLGTEDQNEWYFFSHKDKKYPTGTRTNRATTAGFWKATGRDKAIHLKHELIGMRKTLVFYKGRAPNGLKSDWIMHEYRLQFDENGPSQEDGWAVCRVFKKKMTTVRRMNEHEPTCWFDDQVSFMPTLDSPNDNTSYHNNISWHPCKKEIDHQYHHLSRTHYTHIPSNHSLSLPHFDLPNKYLQQANRNPNNALNSTMMLVPFDHDHQHQMMQHIGYHDHNMYQLVHGRIHTNNVNDQHGSSTMTTTDRRILEKMVTSQFSHEDHHLISDENNENYLNDGPHEDHNVIVSDLMQQDSDHMQPEEKYDLGIN